MSDSPSASTPATEWILVVSSASSRLILGRMVGSRRARDRKSTRLNSSHSQISYAVFCLKKKNRFLDRYKSVLLKLSGEVMAGSAGYGMYPRRVRQIGSDVVQGNNVCIDVVNTVVESAYFTR